MTRKVELDIDFLVDYVNRQPEGREQFVRRFFQEESPIKTAQTILQVDSPLGVAQAALQTDSPEEAASKLIQNQEQFNRFLELYLQQNKAKNGNVATDETLAE